MTFVFDKIKSCFRSAFITNTFKVAVKPFSKLPPKYVPVCSCRGDDVRMKYSLSEFLETFSFGRREKNRQLRLPRFTPAGRFIFIYETGGWVILLMPDRSSAANLLCGGCSAQKVSPCPQRTRIFIIRTKDINRRSWRLVSMLCSK